jgi:uncharacterized protein (TIGR00251 family)
MDERWEIIEAHVRPKAGRTRVAGLFAGAIKVEVAAPPEGGRANAAAAEAIADFFGLPRRCVELEYGERSRVKRFRIYGLAKKDIISKIASLSQDA